MPIVLRPPTERPNLHARLSDLGVARKVARVAAGGFAAMAAVLAVLAAGCAFDSVYGLPPLGRAAVLLAALAVGGLLVRRGVWGPLTEPVGPQAMAHLLEARHPKLNDSLASAVDFLATDNPSTSARFRRIAVVRAQRALDKLNTEALVPSTKAWRFFWLAVAVIIVAAGLAIWKPAHAGQSLLRVADPFGAHPWPTKTQIQLDNPTLDQFPLRRALGEPFDLAFVLRGELPDHATVAVQIETGARYEEVVPVPPGEPDTKKVHVALTLEPHRVPQSFKFQIRAGDATTPWLAVTLAPAPKLVPRDGRPSPQMHLTYPAYTDLTPLPLPDGSGVIEAVHGTRVKFSAATDRPVVSAALVPLADRSSLRIAASVSTLAGQHPLALPAVPLLADESYADITVNVTDGTKLDAEFTPAFAGQYLLKFTDDTGLSGTRLLEFRITPDPAPVVTLDRPTPGKDPLLLLPTASTTIRATATDRVFALKGMTIEYRVGGPGAPLRSRPLMDLSGVGVPLAALAGSAVGFSHGKQPSAEATITLPISRFTNADGKPPADGDRITIRAAATDYDEVTVRKEPGRSLEEVTILVVSRAALDTTLQQQLAELRPRLLKLREQQRQAREKTEEVQKAAADGKLRPDDGPRLGQTERDQRGIRTDVTDTRDGVQPAVELLQSTIRANGVPRSTVTDRVETLAGDLKRLADQNLDPVEPLVASAKQEADAPKPDPKKVADDLRRAVARQKAAEGNFDAMLKLLEQWGGAGEVKAEARAIQEQLTKAGAAGQDATGKVDAGKPAEQLTPKEKAELGKAAEAFERLADRTAGVIGKAESLADKKAERAADLNKQADAKDAEAKAAPDKPTADKLNAQVVELRADAKKAQTEADSLRRAVQNSGNQDLVNDLRTAADALSKNNPEKSAAAQQSAGKRLDGIADALSEKPPDAADELVKKGQAADDAFKLEQEQEGLMKKVEAAAKIEDAGKRDEELKKLAREQEQLQKKAEDLLEKLTRQREDAAADAVRESVEQMQAAKEQLEQGKAPQMEEKQALDKLKETVDKLDKEKEQDEKKLSEEKKGELAKQLKGLRDRLQAADDEAGRLHTDVITAKKWTLPRQRSLSDLESRLKAVAEELRQFTAKELDPLPVYKQLADQAATQTEGSAKRFAQRLEDVQDAAGDPFDPVAEAAADDRTRRPLKTALRRLGHILDSLDDKKPDAGDGPKPNEQPMPMPMGEEPMPMGEQPPNGVPPLAQLKALRSIQAELNTRTRDFHKAHSDKKELNPADQEELDELERSQREVAELFDKLKKDFQKAQEPKLP